VDDGLLPEAAADASAMTCSGMAQFMASQYSCSGARNKSMAHVSALHSDLAHSTALGRYALLSSLVVHMPNNF
jgi:hypothetical protein